MKWLVRWYTKNNSQPCEAYFDDEDAAKEFANRHIGAVVINTDA